MATEAVGCLFTSGDVGEIFYLPVNMYEISALEHTKRLFVILQRLRGREFLNISMLLQYFNAIIYSISRLLTCYRFLRLKMIFTIPMAA